MTSTDQKLKALREALIEGEESGPAEPFDFDAFLLERNRNYVTKQGVKSLCKNLSDD